MKRKTLIEKLTGLFDPAGRILLGITRGKGTEEKTEEETEEEDKNQLAVSMFPRYRPPTEAKSVSGRPFPGGSEKKNYSGEKENREVPEEKEERAFSALPRPEELLASFFAPLQILMKPEEFMKRFGLPKARPIRGRKEKETSESEEEKKESEEAEESHLPYYRIVR